MDQRPDDAPDARPAPDAPSPVDRTVSGPLDRASAGQLLDQGAALLEGGDYGEALATYQRVVGFDDPDVTAAALLGMAQARYRMDDEDAAVRTWEAILELPETTSTYLAWRNVAAARVRDGDLQGAIAAYREADRRAPTGDKAEIANRLGWLAKETGNVRASRRYFARGRGSVLPYATYAIIGITVAVSLTSMLSLDGQAIFDALQLDKPAIAAGEIWRLWTVTLLHDPGPAAPFSLHLILNMYALYVSGPIVERLYGSTMTVIFSLVCAAGGSLGSFAFGEAPLAIGASGAVFGLFGILLIASRTHHPALDRASRNFIGQLGGILLINVLIGLAASSYIDTAAHAGGFVTGALLGVAFVPGRVATMRSMWQAGAGGQLAGGFIGSQIGRLVALLVLVVALAVCAALGFARWG